MGALFASAVAFDLSLCLFLVVSGNISLYSKYGHFSCSLLVSGLKGDLFQPFCSVVLSPDPWDLSRGRSEKGGEICAVNYSTYLCSEIARIILFVRSLQLSYMVALTLAE